MQMQTENAEKKLFFYKRELIAVEDFSQSCFANLGTS